MVSNHFSKPLSNKQAVISMLVCSIMWSIGGIFIKLIPWNPIIIAGIRSLIALPVVYIYIRLAGLKLKLNKKNVFTGLFLFMTIILFVPATKLTTAANAIVLQYSSPVFIILLNIFLYKQRPRRKDLFAVIAAMAGILLCFADKFGASSPTSLLGDFLAILSGIGVAVFFVFGNKSDSLDDNLSAIFAGHLITFACSVPFILLSPPVLTLPSAAFILLLGVVQIGIPYILYGRAIKAASPLMCSLLAMLEPLLNPVWVFIGVGEKPSAFSLLGGVIVIAVVTVWSLSNIKDAANNTL